MGGLLVNQLRTVRALRSRAFALLWTGQTISSIGDGVFLTSLAWQVLLLTHSGTAMGLIITLQTVPMLLIILVGGAVADRFSRRSILFWSDAIRAVIVIFISILGWFHALQMWHLLLMAPLFGIADGMFRPAYQAIPVQIVKTDDLPSANALNGFSQQANQLLGPVIGAAIIAFSGTASAFFFDGLTFIISTISLFAMRIPETPQPQQTDRTSTPSLQRIIKILFIDIYEGLSYVLKARWLWLGITVAAVSNQGLVGPLVVALPKLVTTVYKADVWLLGSLGAAVAAGSIIGSIVIGHLHQVQNKGRLLCIAGFIASCACILLGIPLVRLAASILAISANVFIGIGIGMINVIWITLLQERVPEEKLGRVSSIDWLGTFCLTPLGFLLAGILADAASPIWPFIICGSVSLLMWGIAFSVKEFRSLK